MSFARSALLLVVVPLLNCARPAEPDEGRVRIALSPLSLPGVRNACYTISVTAHDALVWSESELCADRYGDDGGSLTYIGPCDASGDGQNTVSLVVEDLYYSDGTTAPVDRATWQNPCGEPSASDYDGHPPCTRVVHCRENEDVSVLFDLTIMRDAMQGFFDVAVDFEDIFCSAKVDCQDGNGDALLLVPDPDSGARIASVVLAFACTDGDPGADEASATHLYLDDLMLRCGRQLWVVDPSAGPGLVYPGGEGAPPPLVQAMVFETAERLLNGGLDADKLSWSVALGLDTSWLAALPATTECRLESRATASRGPLVGGATPAGAIYPYIAFSVPLFADGAIACTRHPLDGDAPHDGVATDYTDPDAPLSFTSVARKLPGPTIDTARVGRAISACATAVACPANTVCVDDVGGYHCACAPGFSGDPLRGCGDIDACVVAPCPVGSTCTDEPAPAPGDISGRICGPWEVPPEGAEVVSDEEFAVLAATGTLVPVSTDKEAQDAAGRAARAAEDAITLNDIVARRPDLAARIFAVPDAQAGVTVLPDGNYEIQVPGFGATQTVITHGGETRLREIAAAARRFNTLENQVAIYQTIHPRIPDDCLPGLPAPEGIAGLGLEALKALNHQVAACWRIASADFGPSGEVAPLHTDPADFEGTPPEPESGYAGEGGGNCEHEHEPYGYYEGEEWVGKAFDSPVKSQGKRGTCVAFAIAGAMEQSIARNFGHFVNLSEQAIYAKAKLTWDPDSYKDGLPTTNILEKIASSHFAAPLEAIWPYNDGRYRVSCGATVCSGTSEHYAWSCEDPTRTFQYEGPACGEAVHEAKLVYHNHKVSYWTPTTTANGVYGIDSGIELDDIESDESAALANLFMAQGYSVVIAMDIYKSFKDVLKATDSDPYEGISGAGRWYGIEDDDHFVGSHAMEASGVAGGLLILKNSWGSCWGDGGYAYIFTRAAADGVMISATAIVSKALGVNSTPVVTVTSPHDGEHFALGGIDNDVSFAASATDVEDGSACCAFKWTEGATVLSTLPSFHRPAPGPGTHTYKLAVTDSMGKKVTRTFVLHFDNSAPVVTIETPSPNEVIYRGTPFVVLGSASDANQPLGVPYSKLTWTSTVAGDFANGAIGTALQLTFTTLGSRTLTLTAVDDFGTPGSKSVTINVVDVPASGPPIVSITSPVGTLAKPANVPNPLAPLAMTAAVTSPGGYSDCGAFSLIGDPCVHYAWSARYTYAGAAYKAIGSKRNLTWTPSNFFQSDCSGYPIQLRLCATDGNGTTCKYTWVFLRYPPC